eukprot:5965634-Prymnesium_polylepis.3
MQVRTKHIGAAAPGAQGVRRRPLAQYTSVARVVRDITFTATDRATENCDVTAASAPQSVVPMVFWSCLSVQIASACAHDFRRYRSKHTPLRAHAWCVP